MRITTLGPIAVDGRPIRGRRLAAVIRELVAARGRPVSLAALVSVAWPESPPEKATGAIQAIVSRARGLGLPVVTASGGYSVPAEQVSVDVVEVRLLVERAGAALRDGDVSTARRHGDAARSFFPEIPELIGNTDARLLAEVAALRAQAALAGAGPFDETDLRTLAESTPPDEPSAALLVRVLAAQGRDAEALELVERLRSELADRYGTDLSPAVAQAHVALLRGDLSPQTGVEEPRSQPLRAVSSQPEQEVQPGPSEVDGRPPGAGSARADSGAAAASRLPAVDAHVRVESRAAEGLPASWRRPVTPLIGRERDVIAVGAMLGDAALVTVVATGGAGKTRLAGEVARRAVAAGRLVAVVELAGVRSPGDVRPAVLAAVTEPGREPTLPGGGLLILDNCEHVLASAAVVVADLLATAPTGASVLATSRAPLSLAGETVHPLLALPDGVAIELLTARVRAGGGAASWPLEESRQLCHGLDNLPLALELAAARLRHAPIADLLAGLTDRFDLLDGALRGRPERHTGLWAMVDWSYKLLTPAEQDLLRRLAVLPGSFTAEAAAAAGGVSQAGRGLAALVEQSLLSFVDTGGPARYRMAETVREFAQARLDATGDQPRAMTGMLGWARSLSITLAAEMTGPGQPAAMTRCAAEQDNLLACLRWSTAHDRPAAIDIAPAVFHLWTVRGHQPELITWARPLLSDRPPAPSLEPTAPPTVSGSDAASASVDEDRFARVCLYAGLAGLMIGDLRVLAQARRRLRSLPPGVSRRVRELAEVVLRVGTADAGRITTADPYVRGFGMFLRASITDNAGDPLASAGDAEQAYHLFETAGDHWGMGLAAQALGARFGSRGHPRADDWLRRGERHLARLGTPLGPGTIRVTLRVRQAFAGDEEALHQLRMALASGDLDRMETAHATLGVAQLLVREERYAEAATYLAPLLETARAAPIPVPQGRVVFRSAVAFLALQIAAGTATGEAPAAELLRLAAADAGTLQDRPVIGAWALAGAALAGFRRRPAQADQLWGLAQQLGADPAFLVPQGPGRILGPFADRGGAVDPAPEGEAFRPAAGGESRTLRDAAESVREMLGELLGSDH